MKSYTLSNIFNFSGINLLIIFSAFLGKEKLAADMAIIIGCSFFFTQLFSSNSRNILIINYNDKEYFQKIFLRIKLSLLIFLLINIFNYIYFKEISYVSLLISLIIVLQWINELYLLKIFQKNKNSKLNLYLSINILFYFSIFTSFLFEQIYSINLYLIIFALFNLFFLVSDIIKNKYHRYNYKVSLLTIFSKDLSNFSFYSSFSMVFINFISRIIILEFLSKDLSGILFACISLGSIPGSIFNNSFGPYLIKNKINIFSKNYFFVFLFLFIISVFIIYDQNQLIKNSFNFDAFKFDTLYLCYLGSFFMVIALYFRQYLLFRNKSKLYKIFVIDVINSLIYLFIILSVCFINLQVFFSLIFLIFSIYNFLIFSAYLYFEKNTGITN